MAVSQEWEVKIPKCRGCERLASKVEPFASTTIEILLFNVL